MKKIILSFCALFVFSLTFAQNITTASAYFKTISEYYGTIKDYEVDFEIKVDKSESRGKLSFKAPNLLRMDYTNPEEQVICFNGDMLTIYIKEPAEAVLQQQVTPGSSGSASTMTAQAPLQIFLHLRAFPLCHAITPLPTKQARTQSLWKKVQMKWL